MIHKVFLLAVAALPACSAAPTIAADQKVGAGRTASAGYVELLKRQQAGWAYLRP